MTTAIQSHTVPEAIVKKLQRLIWRARHVLVLRGALATLAMAVVSVLTIMAIDLWVVIFSDWARWALSMSGLGLTVLVALWLIVRPLARSFTLTGVARLIESRHPELHERISSTVELLTTEDGPELRGSDALIAALADEAVVDAGTVRPSKEIHFKAAVPYLITAAVVVAVLAGVIAIWPAQAQRLFQRALLANVSRVSRTALSIARISAPDLKEWEGQGFEYVMMAGRRLHVELLVNDPAVSSAELRTGPLAGGEERPLAMTRMPDAADGSRRFAITCPPAPESFRFRLHAGDALTRYYGVKVVEQPEISRIDLRYAYPAYTCREVELRPAAGGDVAAVPGTVATITARTNKPVMSAEFLLDGTARPGGMSTAPDGAAVCTFPVRITKNMKTRWSARLEDEYGFVNEPAEYAVKAIRDKRPGVDVLVPNTTRLKLKPTDSLPIAYRLRDDFGLISAAMLVEVDGQTQPPMALPVPPDTRPRRKVEGRTVLDLSALPVEGARQVTFRLRAGDILPPELGGPQEGFSELFTIQLDVEAPSFTEQIVLAEELRLREVLEKVLKELKETKKDSAPLRHMVPKAQSVTQAIIERVDRMRKHLASADAMLREVIAETAEGIYAAFTEKLTTLADDHVAKALDLAGQVKLTDKRKERAALADEADFQVDRSIALVQELLKELGALTEQLTQAMELQDLAVREEELVEALEEMLQDANEQVLPGEMPPAEMMSPEEWQKAQEQLAGELAEMTRQMPGALEAQLQKDTQRTKDLLAEARKLARDQKKLQQETQQAVKTEKVDEALAKLAEKQEKLAKDAAATESAADQSKPMAEAADDIKADQLQDAVGKQQQAEQQLDQRADLGAEAKAAESLADKADRIAKQQEQIAKQADAAKKGLETAEAKAAEADKQAEAAKKQAAEAGSRLAQQAKDAQARQQALAQEAKALQKDAAANPPTAEAAKRTQPAAEMDRAAQAAGRRDMDQAAAHARSAHQQADRLAQDLGKAAQNAAKAAAAAPKPQQAEKQKQAQAAAQTAQKATQIAQKQKGLAEEFAQAAGKSRGEQSRSQQAAQKAASQQGAARQEAAAAKRQAHQLTAQQQNVAQRASEVIREAARAGEKAKQAAQQHNPTGEMKQAARAMQASQPPEAAQKAAEAAQKARQLAQALRGAADVAPKGAKDQAPQLADLSRRQAEIRKETQKLLAQRKSLQQTATSRELARLQREQAQIAREAGELSDQVKKDAPQSDRIDTQAAQAARDAANELAARDVAKAADSATEAGEKLGEMGERLNQEVGRKPSDSGEGAKPSGEQVAAQGSTAQEPDQVGDRSARQMARKAELADTAEDLGRRQERVAGQIRALAEGNPTAMAAAKQADIAERTGELAEDVGRIQEHAEELIPDDSARQEAAEANQQLGRALTAQGKASKALEAGKPSEAMSPEGESGQALTAAASALARLGSKLAQAAAKNRSPEPAEESQDMADAYDMADEAAESQQLSDAALAAEQLNALAQSAMAQARAMGIPIGQMSPTSLALMLSRPRWTLDSRFGTGIQLTDLTAAKLEKLGISLSDWARLPGKLRDQVLQAAGTQSPEEYRSLIQRYFREVARRGAPGGAAKSTEGPDKE